MKYIASLLLLLVCALPAGAEVLERGGVRANLPAGWTMTTNQGGNNIMSSTNVLMYSPGRDGQIILSIFNINATGAESLADGMSEKLKGTKPEAVRGGFAFTFVLEGKNQDDQPIALQGKSFVAGKGKYLGSLTAIGNSPDLKGILESLGSAEPELKELLDHLRPSFISYFE